MASRDDRHFIQTVRAIPSTTKMVPSNEDRERKWTSPPVPIPIPKSSAPARQPQYGHAAVKNPYARISTSTNPTAKQTILNRKQRTPRKTVRPSDMGLRIPLGTTSRDKGKGRAAVPSVPFPSSPSPEVIDVDADHASTDDLNISPGSPPIQSSYFGSKAQSSLRKIEESNVAAGPSLIGDGDNTKQLRILHDGTQQRARSTSPISSYTEDDEIVRQQALKPNSKVQKRVAEIEERTAKAKARAESAKSFPSRNRNTPVVDFRNRSIKSKMQPKAGFAKAKLKLVPKCNTDALSEPSGLRSNNVPAKQQVLSLPISKLVLGIQLMFDYDFLEFENATGAIKFISSRPLTPSFGPIDVVETFCEMQSSALNTLSDEDTPIILHLISSPQGNISAPWQLHYNSIFQKGAGDEKGYITILFNPKHKQWNPPTYKACINKLSKLGLGHTLLVPKAAETLWSHTSKTKYAAEYQPYKYPTDADEEQLHRKYIISKSDVNPGVHDESQDSDLALIEPLSKRQHIAEPRRTSHDESAQSLRKRPPDSCEHKDSLEDIVAEPPSKRRRTEEAKPLRRSTRRSAQQDKAAKVDLDEVILVYPFGAPGAVNVTAGDLNRLQPEEFLNDTLIEFGLKSWLKELEVTDPVLAAQVHVFNSFFYKKLNKRSIKEGYDSVRKWTSKIDIFSKKYIIIPINENLHWYLAVIYEPEHTLRPPPPSLIHPATPVTRRQTRESRSSEKMVEPSNDTLAEPIHQEQADADDQDMPDGTASENEVEQLAFSTSCSITITSGGSTTTSSATNLKEELIRDSGATEPEEGRGSPMEVDPDLTSNEAKFPAKFGVTASVAESGATGLIEVLEDPPVDLPNGSEVTPARFYGKSYLGKDSDGGSIIIGEDALPRTKIFILDSLGNRHPQAIKQLTKWLEMEASDKRKIETITPPVAKMAPVPVQPNYCDCGLYILHFAATFLSDPQHYCHIIMTKERPNMPERQADWKDASVSLMRENLRQKILQFSDEWYQMRAAREVQKQENVEGSDEDSDVAIVEQVRPNKKGRLNKSARTKS